MSATTGPAVDLKSIRLLSRAISAVENETGDYQNILASAYRAPALSRVVGVTGPPGVGKSTLVDALTEYWAKREDAVAVLAVDPSSPFSGGAVLGDRVRMDRSSALPGVYLRSVSARGEGGGLSAAICDILALLNEAGFPRALLETVGAGQSDIAVAEAADCTLVVGAPGLGDHIQSSKAGMMEVGDIYVVNKADLPGANATAAQVESALAVAYSGAAGVNFTDAHLASPHAPQSAGRRALVRRHGDPATDQSAWRPPVHLVNSTKAEGVEALARSVDSFLDWCALTNRLTVKRSARFRAQILRELAQILLSPYRDGDKAEALARWSARIAAGDTSPSEAAAALAIERVSNAQR